MNDQDRLQLEEIKRQMNDISNSVNRLSNAILGDAMAGSIGLVERLIKIEATKKEMFERIELLEDAKKQVYAYAVAISAAISTLMGTLFAVFKLLRM
jgi:hypothetical protein